MISFIDRIRKRFDERDGSCGTNIRKRLSVCGDLLANELLYHIQCHAKFSFDKSKDTSRACGGPECPKMQAAFNQMCDWLENEIELFTLHDVKRKMAGISDEEVNGVKSSRIYTKTIYLLLKSLGGSTLFVLKTWSPSIRS